MGLSNSLIAIKGNHLENTTQIFGIFGYVDRHKNKKYDKWESTADYLFTNYFDLSNKNIAIRGIWIDNGWTIICDPEMVDTIEDEKISQLSKDLKTSVLTFMVQSNSRSFWFAKYDKVKQRHIFVVGGLVAENIGSPLPEEEGLNINENIFIDDVIKLANNFGVDFEVSNVRTTFTIKEFDYSEQLQDKSDQMKQPSEFNKKEMSNPL